MTKTNVYKHYQLEAELARLLEIMEVRSHYPYPIRYLLKHKESNVTIGFIPGGIFEPFIEESESGKYSVYIYIKLSKTGFNRGTKTNKTLSFSPCFINGIYCKLC